MIRAHNMHTDDHWWRRLLVRLRNLFRRSK